MQGGRCIYTQTHTICPMFIYANQPNLAFLADDQTSWETPGLRTRGRERHQGTRVLPLHGLGKVAKQGSSTTLQTQSSKYCNNSMCGFNRWVYKSTVMHFTSSWDAVFLIPDAQSCHVGELNELVSGALGLNLHLFKCLVVIFWERGSFCACARVIRLQKKNMRWGSEGLVWNVLL